MPSRREAFFRQNPRLRSKDETKTCYSNGSIYGEVCEVQWRCCGQQKVVAKTKKILRFFPLCPPMALKALLFDLDGTVAGT